MKRGFSEDEMAVQTNVADEPTKTVMLCGTISVDEMIFKSVICKTENACRCVKN